MNDLIVKAIMGNIAQTTQLFDTVTQITTCDVVSNTITIAGLNGDYVLSGAVSATAGVGCINGLHNFVDGVAVTDCFFGDVVATLDCVYHQINAGTALTRELAIEMMIDEDVENVLIAYWENTQNTKGEFVYSISAENVTKLQVNFGLMMKVKVSQIEALGSYDVLDLVLANSVIETGNDSASLVRFDGINARFFAGNYYVVDVGFSYLVEMDINDIIKTRLKDYNAVLDTLTSN